MFSQIVVQVAPSTAPCFVVVRDDATATLRIVLDPGTGRQLQEALNIASELPAAAKLSPLAREQE